MGSALYLAGYTPVYEPWMYLYISIIAISGFVSWGVIVADLLRVGGLRDCPKWMMISGGMAFLFCFSPIGIWVVFTLNIFLLVSSAPIGASIVSCAFTVFPYYAFGKMVSLS